MVGDEGGNINFFNSQGEKLQPPMSCDSTVRCVDWHDNCIAAGDVNGKIYVFDAAAGKIKSSMRGHRYAPSLSKECFLSFG